MEDLNTFKNGMETYTGKLFNYGNPTKDMLDLVDIAHALAHTCRYGGHTKFHYSVAQHSVLVSMIACSEGMDINHQRWGLLHDASEAYLGDVPRSLKILPAMLGYRTMEHDLMTLVSQRYGLKGMEPAAIKRIDTQILGDEQKALYDTKSDWELPYPPYGVTIAEKSPEEAREAFMFRAGELGLA